MLEKFNQWLRPPIFPGDVEKTEQARLLNRILLYILVILFFVAIVATLVSSYREIVLGILLALFLISLFSRYLLLRRRFELAGQIMAVSTWIVIWGVALYSDGIASAAMASLISITIVFGLLLRNDIGNKMMFASIVAASILTIIHQVGMPLPRYFEFSYIENWLAFTASMIMVGMGMNFGLGRLENALAQARRRVEVMTHQSDAMFRAMFENIDDGIIFSDAEGLASYRSPVYQRIDGYSTMDWGGLNDFEQTHPEERDLLRKTWATVLQNPTEPIRVEYRIRHKNGSWVWVQTIFQNLLSDPDIQSIVLTTRDITEKRNIEEALKLNEQKYSALFNNSAVPAALTKLPEGTFVDVNQAFLNDFGYDRHEIIGKTSLEIGMARPEERAETVSALAKNGVANNVEKHIYTRAGEERIALINVRKMKLGSQDFAITTIHDITERKKSERAQAEAYEKMEKLFEILPVGVSVLDRERNIVKQNPALERILQITADGLARGDYLRRAYVRSDGSPMPENEFASYRVLQGEPNALDVETGVVREDGEIIWVNVSAIAVPFSDWSTVVVTSDITERKRSEQALLESEERYRSLIEQSADGIALTDENGILIEWNRAQAELTGLPREEALGRPSWKVQLRLTPGENLEKFSPESIQASMKSIFTSGVSPYLYKPMEFDIATLTGERRTIVQTSFPVKAGNRYRLGIIARDVTERRRMEKALRQHDADVLQSALEERQRMARELHDSVGQVLGYVGFQADAARQLYAAGRNAEADAQLARLASVAQDAHADVREYILNLRVAPDMHKPFFEEVKKYLESYSRNYDIKTDLEVGAEVREDLFDVPSRLQLFRIMQEALSNTRKYAASNHVTVSFEVKDTLARMAVQDDGSGFDPDQVAADGRPHFGLSFISERAEQLGGSAHVRSAPGEGTRILVEIPCKKGDS